ncbi:MAG TPA: aromatic amino acid ammonia-lyase [Ktedonobacteraceae bacterium]
MKLTGENLSIFDVQRVAIQREVVELDVAQLKKVQEVCELVQTWGEEKHPIYGVNTGFGELTHIIIPPQFKTELQINLLRSHAAGGGDPLPEEVVRAIMTVRLNYFMKGYSGISTYAVTLLQHFINHQIHPVIPQQGSLGASGDLAPLSHMALPLVGDGYVTVHGEVRKAVDVLREENLEPVKLGYKEALTMINGTSAMTGTACIALTRARQLLKLAVIATADMVQCLQGSTRPFDTRGHKLKNHAGQVAIAQELLTLLEGSKLTRDHRDIMQAIVKETSSSENVQDIKVYLQDAYSLRCIPQILGPVLDTLDTVKRVIEEEVNSCNDNPLIFETPEDIFHGGNFHGQYVSMYSDFLNVALAEIGVTAERQLNRLVDPHLNNGLPPFLAHINAGLYSGFEGAQYLATSIASENLDLAAPSSIKSIPSNGANQDIVSMGLNAARKSLQLTKNVSTILSVLIAACYQSSTFVGADNFSPTIQALHTEIAKSVSQYQDAVPMFEYITAVNNYLTSPQGQLFIDEHVHFASDFAAPALN